MKRKVRKRQIKNEKEQKRKENKRQPQQQQRQQTAVAFYNPIDVRARSFARALTRRLGQRVHSHFIFPNIYF